MWSGLTFTLSGICSYNGRAVEAKEKMAVYVSSHRISGLQVIDLSCSDHSTRHRKSTKDSEDEELLKIG